MSCSTWRRKNWRTCRSAGSRSSPSLWKSTETLLTTYSDANFVSEEYAKELSTARSHAIEVERVSDDPPERIGSWLSTVSDPEVRKLDQQLVLDLLQIETREDAWRKVLTTAIELIDQLVLSGNVVVAQPLLDRLVASAAEGQPFVQAARDGLDQLRAGPLMKHVVLFVRQAHDSDVRRGNALLPHARAGRDRAAG